MYDLICVVPHRYRIVPETHKGDVRRFPHVFDLLSDTLQFIGTRYRIFNLVSTDLENLLVSVEHSIEIFDHSRKNCEPAIIDPITMDEVSEFSIRRLPQNLISYLSRSPVAHKAVVLQKTRESIGLPNMKLRPELPSEISFTHDRYLLEMQHRVKLTV